VCVNSTELTQVPSQHNTPLYTLRYWRLVGDLQQAMFVGVSLATQDSQDLPGVSAHCQRHAFVLHVNAGTDEDKVVQSIKRASLAAHSVVI
jgi:hypothetical protein